MKIYFKKRPANITLLMRRLGYVPDKRQRPGFLSFSRRVGSSDYPKFHIYINPAYKNVLNLHLDMKKPSYRGSHAHSGEYDSDLVKEEAWRIKNEAQS